MHAHRHILVVDDDPDAREMLAVLLQLEGFHVTTAADGRKAVASAIEEMPDVALLDIHMPGMDGIDAAIELRKHPLVSTMRIVMATAVSESECRIRFTDYDAFLPKPCPVPRLLAVLTRP